MSMIERLYELVTGRPYLTVRSTAAEFGPPPGARYAAELAAYTDGELVAHGPEILARVAARRRPRPTPDRDLAAVAAGAVTGQAGADRSGRTSPAMSARRQGGHTDRSPAATRVPVSQPVNVRPDMSAPARCRRPSR